MKGLKGDTNSPKKYIICKVDAPNVYYINEQGVEITSLNGVKVFSDYNKALKEIKYYKEVNKSKNSKIDFIILEQIQLTFGQIEVGFEEYKLEQHTEDTKQIKLFYASLLDQVNQFRNSNKDKRVVKHANTVITMLKNAVEGTIREIENDFNI